MERKSQQIRALFRKSFSLQMRQIGTNICQITTPVLCLLLVYLMKSIVQTQISHHIKRPTKLQVIPRFLNPPILTNEIYFNLVGLGFKTCLEWYLYDIQDPSSVEFVGELTGQLYFQPNTTTRSGLLGQIQNFYCQEQWRSTPFFAKPRSSVNEDIFSAIQMVDSNQMHHYYSKYKNYIPDGAVTFKTASEEKVKYKAQINDHRYTSYHRYNGISKIGLNRRSSRHFLTITGGMLSLMDKIHSALFSLLFEDIQIISLVQFMPVKVDEEQQLNRLLNVIGASLYPIALSLLLPVFMYTIVLEKEEKLQDFMKMNGMKISNYWIVNFLFNLMIYVFTVGIFLCFGAIVLKLQFFTQTNRWILFIFFLGWGIAQIGLAFFIQVFLSKARTATIWGYLLSIWTVLWGITLNVGVYPLPYTLPSYLLLFPHFAMARGIYILSYNCGYWKCIESFNEVSEELKWSIVCLWLTGIFILAISIYLNEIVPRQYGVWKHPFFLCERKKKQEPYIQLQEFSINKNFQIGFSQQDHAVSQHRLEVHQTEFPYREPLIIKDLSKTYKGKNGKADKLAVNKMCLKIQQGEFFGLLGPNGAGKTTLISILTGLYKPDSGKAWISGYDITTELDSVQMQMGVCPQFDILWPDLTIEQHLLFYARIKGISPHQQKFKVKQAIEGVLLGDFAKFKSKQLSGGMKRRLSVAIALVGNPKIIFLDQPTTGLDPENRRQLWEILARCKERRAIFLTTHSMEEADVLCTKISIVNEGILRCIGPQVTLKSLYGGGYHLFVNVKKIGVHQIILDQSVKAFVEQSLPRAVLLSEFNGNLIYQVPETSCRLSHVFRKFESEKEKVGIADWGMSQSSLEDVFLKVIGDY